MRTPTYLIGCIFTLLLLGPANVAAQQIVGWDLFLLDPTPGIVFDDTDSGGWDYVIRGRDEFFHINHEGQAAFLYYDPTQFNLALGHNASSSGAFSVSLGTFAVSDGEFSTALGAYAEAGGANSTALGFFAASGGDNSTAIGHRAFAPNPDTIVLGEIPGVNLGENYQPVAMGTTNPLAALHIFRDDGSARVLVEETNTDAVPRTLFRLASAGSNAKFEIENTMAGASWAFTNSGSDFRMSLQDSGVVEFRVDNTGDAYLAGVLFTNSDRNAKTDITPVDPDVILDKVSQLPIAEWAYKESPNSRHIGPMAQDFHAAFHTGTTDTSLTTLDLGGVAIASVQALRLKNDALEQAVDTLSAENQSLQDRLAKLESLMGVDQLAQTAP